jgi:hypothetical protein
MQFSETPLASIPTSAEIALKAILGCKTHVGRLDIVHRVNGVVSACAKIACVDLFGSCYWLTSSASIILHMQNEMPDLELNLERDGLVAQLPDDESSMVAMAVVVVAML